MFERYSERARRVIFFARYEASQLGSVTIETEHLLLGLFREDKNITRFVPRQSIENICELITARLTVGEKVSVSIDLPLSGECRRSLAFAAEEAQRLNHRHIDTEHLLLGILREEKCGAAQILLERGFHLTDIREEIAAAGALEDTGGSGQLFSRSAPFFGVHKSPSLPRDGVVADAATALRIAEAVWLPLYGEDTVAGQKPLTAELKFNVWLVTGAKAPEAGLFVFILQVDGRILSVGRGSEKKRSV